MRRIALLIALAAGMLALTAASLQAQTTGSNASAPPPSLGSLDDAPEPLPKREGAKDLRHADRLEAAAHVAAGRLLFQREDYAGALRHDQRAWRFDPSAIHLLRDIVGLSFQLNRQDEGARYAVIQAERDPRDPGILVELANYLTVRGDWQRAIGLYEQGLKLTKDKPLDAEALQVRLRAGRLYFLTDDHVKAAEAFAVVREAVEKPEKFGLNDAEKKEMLADEPVLCRLMGEIFLKADRPDDARAMFARAIRLVPNEGQEALDNARLAFHRQDVDEALSQLEKVFAAKLSQAGSEPYEVLEKALARKHPQEAEAKQALRERLKALWENDQANQQLGPFYGQKLLEAERLDEAEAVYRKMLAEQETAEAHQGLMEVARRRGDGPGFMAALGDALEKAQSTSLVQEQLKKASESAELTDRALDEANRLAREKTLSQGQALGAALLAMRGKRFDPAEKMFLQAVSLAQAEQKGQTLLTWGLEMLLADQHESAARALRRAIDDRVSSEDNATFYYHLAGALELSGRTDDALAAARRAADLEPGEPSYHARAAWVKHHARRYDEAKKDYQEVLKTFDKDREPAELRETLHGLRVTVSAICVRLGQLDEAEEWLHEALDEFPEDVGALNDLGYLWADRGKHLLRALEMTQVAAAAEPDNSAYLDSVGWALFRLGRFDEAASKLEKAVAAEEEPDGVILDHLGDAYSAQKRLDKARDLWTRAAAAFSKEDDKEKLAEVRRKIEKSSPSGG